MSDLLTRASEAEIKNKLLKADYHGALFRGPNSPQKQKDLLLYVFLFQY
jgi:hypothetical protein